MKFMQQKERGGQCISQLLVFSFSNFCPTSQLYKLTQTLQPFSVTTYKQNGEGYLKHSHMYTCKCLVKENGLWDRHPASPIKLYLQCSIKHHSVAFYTTEETQLKKLIIPSEQIFMLKPQICEDRQTSKTIFSVLLVFYLIGTKII